MGSQGFKVYRHKKRFFIYYNPSDSYPSEFGCACLGEVPQTSAEGFQEWVESRRTWLDEEYESWLQNGCKNTDDFSISDYQPQKRLYIDWVYEIDLDRLVFHVNSQPLFHLNNRPPADVFVRSLYLDHYGNNACVLNMPEEYRYYQSRAPLPVDQAVIDAYWHLAGKSPVLPLHAIFATREELSTLELTWQRYLEVLIGQIPTHYSERLLKIQIRANRSDLTKSDRALALTIVNMAFPLPPTIHETDETQPLPICADDIWWVRDNACVFVTALLDNERNLQSAIMELHSKVQGNPNRPDIVYGVVTSVHHIVIVRLHRSGAFQHTPALQLVPSFHAVSPSTPGITALARLGRHTQAFAHIASLPRLPSSSRLRCLPVEILNEIAGYLDTPQAIQNFALSADQVFTAVTMPHLAYPKLGSDCVVSAAPLSPDDQKNDNLDPEYGYLIEALVCGQFEVLTGNGPRTLFAKSNIQYSESRHQLKCCFSPIKLSIPFCYKK